MCETKHASNVEKCKSVSRLRPIKNDFALNTALYYTFLSFSPTQSAIQHNEEHQQYAKFSFNVHSEKRVEFMEISSELKRVTKIMQVNYSAACRARK